MDDNEGNRYLLEKLLEGYGYEVVTACNGREALEKLREEKFDLIISDILMPEIDGYQLCHIIKTDERLKKIPFIFYTTTYTSPEDEKFGIELGAEEFIIKPIEPDRFIKILNEIINRVKKAKLVPKEPFIKVKKTYYKRYNERLVKKIEDRLNEFTLRSELLEAINRTEELEELIKAVLEWILKTVPTANRASFLLLNEEKNVFEFIATLGQKLEPLKQIKIPSDKILSEIKDIPFIIEGDIEEIIKKSLSKAVWETFKKVKLPKSLFYIPIKENDKLIGIFIVSNEEIENAFTDADLYKVEKVHEEIAIALSKAKRKKELDEHKNKLFRSYHIGQELTKIDDIDILTKRIMQILGEDYGYYHGGVFLKEGEHLVIKAFASTIGMDKLKVKEGKKLKIGEEGIVGWVAEHREPLMVNDATKDLRFIQVHESLVAGLAVPIEIEGELLGVLEVESNKKNAFNKEDLELLLSIAGQLAVTISNLKRRKKLEQYLIQTVTSLAIAIEKKDKYTEEHCRRMARIAVKIGKELGLSEENLKNLEHAAILHDIGKIGINGKIIGKPGGLTTEEWEDIKKHPIMGREILEGIDPLKRTAKIVEEHHEHYDGSGYPKGLKKNEILLEARILAAVDACDAMTSFRPYRKALSMEEIIKELRKHAGTQFDPQVVEILIKLLKTGIEKL
ncbi:response regulator [Candidatus Aminicenantes bacterium AH-873-B07]|nr:response regulator [Candidatus Aminicenantes bacterium AH-873-B07]